MDIQLTGVLVSKTGDFINDYQEFDIQGGQEGLNSILAEELEPDTLYWIKGIFVMNGVEYESKPAQFSTVAFVNPFTITNTDNSAITVEIKKFGTPQNLIHIDYIKDGNWCHWNSDDGNLSITLQQNESVIMKGAVGNVFGSDTFDYNIGRSSNMHGWGFAISGPSTVSGNIMYLVDQTGESTAVDSCALGSLFSDCVYTDFDIILPATTLATRCYSHMFYGCTSLTHAPSLPATVLAQFCYSVMFKNCTSLTHAPSLPATTLANHCYNSMFWGCNSLTTVPDLNATTLTDNCYNSMFHECTSLVNAPAIHATTFGYYSCHEMFYGCTSLTNVPDIHANEFGSYSCEEMFRGCSSLTTAPALYVTRFGNTSCRMMFWGCNSLTTVPDLPATGITDGCFYQMFGYCISLVNAPALPATTLATGCYNSMFIGCNSLVNAPALPATTLAQACYANMFKDCSSLNRVITYANDISATNCLRDWLYGVAASGGDFYNLGSATYQTGYSGIPSGWTEHRSL